MAHAVLRREGPTESRAAGEETRGEDPGGRGAEPETGAEGVEAEEETDEAECLVSDDCQFADRAGDGGGEGAGAAGGGGDEVSGCGLGVRVRSASGFLLLLFHFRMVGSRSLYSGMMGDCISRNIANGAEVSRVYGSRCNTSMNGFVSKEPPRIRARGCLHYPLAAVGYTVDPLGRCPSLDAYCIGREGSEVTRRERIR